ncbi:hypothetical protein KR032_005125 [Drosophila birchii]|nr:hypothetical protein KR032_005125 [Drosophila birchii]
MKLANKNLCKIFKDGGLDLAALTFRRQVEIISVYITWIYLLMYTWQMTFYCVDGITSFFQTVMFCIGLLNVGTR